MRKCRIRALTQGHTELPGSSIIPARRFPCLSRPGSWRVESRGRRGGWGGEESARHGAVHGLTPRGHPPICSPSWGLHTVTQGGHVRWTCFHLFIHSYSPSQPPALHTQPIPGNASPQETPPHSGPKEPPVWRAPDTPSPVVPWRHPEEEPGHRAMFAVGFEG